MRTIQAKILEIPGQRLNGKKTSRKTLPKIWANLARPSSFLEILEKVVTFATGSCRKFKPDVLVEWKTPHNAPCLTPKILHNRPFSWVFCVFTHVASTYANLLEQKKAFA